MGITVLPEEIPARDGLFVHQCSKQGMTASRKHFTCNAYLDITFLSYLASSAIWENNRIIDWSSHFTQSDPTLKFNAPISEYSMNATTISSSHRILQTIDSEHKGRTVLTILYLVVLALCFVIPVFYYCRFHCDERQSQAMQDLELRDIQEAYANSVSVGTEETRATRKKYIEERRARLLQLFGPVRMILTFEHFEYLQGRKGDLKEKQEDCKGSEDTSFTSKPLDIPSKAANMCDLELGNYERNEDSERRMSIQIPHPGKHISTSSQLRDVPNDCIICLSSYKIGDDVVWSSNPFCEHCFHTDCMEKWLMKQRGGPMCPCCRRDFVIDPLDDDVNENVIISNFTNNMDSEGGTSEFYENIGSDTPTDGT